MLPATDLARLMEARAALAGLAVVDVSAAQAELEENNARRRTVWGDRAAVLPIVRGNADVVFDTIASCIGKDFALRDARELTVENVQLLDTNAQTRAQLDQLSPGLRAKYERKAARHRGAAGTAAIRKIIVKVTFPQAFSRHEILRIGENAYVGMACNVDAQQPRPAVRKPLLIAFGVMFGIFALFLLAVSLRSPSRPNLSQYARMDMSQLGDPGPVLRSAHVTPEFFAKANVQPKLGRFLLPFDFVPAQRVAVISDSIFAERFAGNPAILGTTISIDGRPAVIVGVAPPGFNEPGNVHVWLAGQ